MYVGLEIERTSGRPRRYFRADLGCSLCGFLAPNGREDVHRKKGCSITVDSKKLEHGCRMIYSGFPSFSGLGLDDGHVYKVCRVSRSGIVMMMLG